MITNTELSESHDTTADDVTVNPAFYNIKLYNVEKWFDHKNNCIKHITHEQLIPTKKDFYHNSFML